MAGLFPGICNSQNSDRNGIPLIGSVLTVYQGGTTTLANCFQDIGLAIPAQNPMTADATGRLPFFYVADGVYRVRLIDQYGIQVYDYLQVASIGASSSGGGGTAVDPTTVLQTGWPFWLPLSGSVTGFVRAAGRTLGSATSGAAERANADAQALFLWHWNNFSDSFCPVVSGRGASAAADWAANKQITLLDMRRITPFGVVDAGNTALPDFSGLTFARGDAVTPGSVLGAAKKTLAISELPVVTPAGVIGGSASFSAVQSTGLGSLVGATARAPNVENTVSINGTSFSFTGTPFGGGAAFDKMPTAMLGTWYLKL